MAYATSRLGTGGMFLRKHDVEPISRARVLSQDRTPVYLRVCPGRERVHPRTPDQAQVRAGAELAIVTYQ